MYEKKLIEIMSTYRRLDTDLKMVRDMQLPHWCIAAGYVRNYVWDYLHSYSKRTELNDVDILYFDPSDLSEETEKKYEYQLNSQFSGYQWSIKNQARMHLRNCDPPYSNVSDAMKRWPETATSVAVTLDNHEHMKIIAPHGLEDLFELMVRKSPYFTDHEYFLSRVASKKWLQTWPKLKNLNKRSLRRPNW